jgi:multisubunit Na+/H+ antiporter MnhC subunit
MPESISFEEVTQMAAVSTVSVLTVYGVLKLTIKYLHLKIIIPMFFASSTVGLAIWYASQSISPALPQNGKHEKPPSEKKSIPIEMQKDSPIIQASIGDSVKRKKMVKHIEIKTIQNCNTKTTNNGKLPPLPPLIPLTGPPKSISKSDQTKKTNTIKEEREVTIEGENKEGDRVEDPFVEALLEYLTKEGLVSNSEKFSLKMKHNQLEVSGKETSKTHLEKALQIFAEKEGHEFTKGSKIKVSKKKGKWSISKTIED